MANVNILNLPVAVSVSGSEWFPLVQGGTTKRATISLVEGYGDGTTTQDANSVYAGPTTGSAAAPAFRALVAADIPAAHAITVGTTTIASGTTTRILYDNAGTLGEYTITGTGTVVAMQTSPSFTTPALGTPSSGVLTNCTGLPTLLVANEATDTTCFPLFATAASGELGPKTNANMTFNSSTGVVTLASSVLTTTDINGGTVDGTIIGGSSAAAITGTTITGTVITGNSFVPNLSTIPSNGMYLPASNTLGWAINSAAELQLTATALSPAADGGNSLGTTALGWQNLFANTGFVLNIEAGDWVATHTAGILTVGTGDLRVTTAGTNAASVVTLNGTQTLANKTLTTPVIGAATGTSLIATGILTARSATATPAAASAVAGLTMGSAAVGIYWGTGSPNTAVAAAAGSVYFRTDGGVNSRLYMNTDGASAWTPMTNAA